MGLYDRDFHAWANEQAALAKARAHNGIDWDNVAEELDSLGKQQRAELTNRYLVLLTHLLKWRFQTARRSRSGRDTIASQRTQIELHMDGSPSLKATDVDSFALAYRYARKEAARQARLPIETFPIDPPFTPEQARDDDFWPEPV